MLPRGDLERGTDLRDGGGEGHALLVWQEAGQDATVRRRQPPRASTSQPWPLASDRLPRHNQDEEKGAGMTAHVVDAPRRKVTLEELRAHRDDIEEIGRRLGVSNIRVFGSVARGDANGNSDLDLLIDTSAETGLFDLAGFALGVEQLMAVFTQVVTVPGLKPRIRDRIVDSTVPL